MNPRICLSVIAAFIVGLPAATAVAKCTNNTPTQVCRILDAAPRAPAADARVAEVIAVWQRIEPPFAALSGRESGLVVLAESARIGTGAAAKPIPPAAYICPGGPPVVYVPWTLVDLVLVKKKYPIDFLAFVLGHELGHRANDFDPDGCQLAAFARPGKGVHEEELADKRSAFFIAIGGFSTRSVANKDMVGAFLEQEYNIRKFTVDKRKKALLSALANMDALEDLYQASLVLAFSGDVTSASRLLAWADELIRDRGVPVPELLVVRALVLMLQAAPHAPWLGKARLPIDASHLRCAPLFPGNTALYEEPDAGAEVRAAGAEQQAAARALKTARKLLDEAADMGAAPLSIASGRACLAFYDGDADAAVKFNATARALAAKTSPKPVLAALLSNDALFAFLAEATTRPAPADRAPATLKAWAKKFASKTSAMKSHAGAMALVAAIARLPARPAAAPPPSKPKCAKGTRPAGKLKLPTAAAASDALGACPAGYKLAHTVPSMEVAKRTGTKTGVTTCVPADGGKDHVWVRITLPAVTSPPMEAVSLTMKVMDGRVATLPTGKQLACSCDEMVGQGTSDRGDKAWMIACAKLGFELGVAFVRPDGTADRLAIIE